MEDTWFVDPLSAWVPEHSSISPTINSADWGLWRVGSKLLLGQITEIWEFTFYSS